MVVGYNKFSIILIIFSQRLSKVALFGTELRREVQIKTPSVVRRPFTSTQSQRKKNVFIVYIEQGVIDHFDHSHGSRTRLS